MPGPRWQEDPLAASMYPPTPLTPLTPEYWAEESAPLTAAMRDEPVSDVTLFGAGQTALAATSIVDPTMASDVASAALYKLEGDDEAAAIAIAAGLAGLGAGALAAKLWKMRQAHKAAMKAKGLSDEAAEAAAAETAEQAERFAKLRSREEFPGDYPIDAPPGGQPPAIARTWVEGEGGRLEVEKTLRHGFSEEKHAQMLADWIDSPPGTPPPPWLDPKIVDATKLFRKAYPRGGAARRGGTPSKVPSPREVEQADLVSEWVDSPPGTPPPAGLDPELIESTRRLQEGFGSRLTGGPKWTPESSRSYIMEQINKMDLHPMTSQAHRNRVFEMSPWELERARKRLRSKQSSMREEEQDFLFADRSDPDFTGDTERYALGMETPEEELLARGMTRPGSQYLQGTGTYSPPTVARRPGPTRADWPGPATEASEQANERARRLALVDRRNRLRDEFGLSEAEAIEAAGELGKHGSEAAKFPLGTDPRLAADLSRLTREQAERVAEMSDNPEELMRIWKLSRGTE